MIRQTLSILGLLFLTVCCSSNSKEFITVKDGKFYNGDSEYSFIGANYWQGMNLAAPNSGNIDRLRGELDQLQDLGITNLRIIAASEGDSDMRFSIDPALQTAPGVYNEDLWQGLDLLLTEMAQRNMRAVMVLGNFWTWSGGFPQYLKWSGEGSIPYPQLEDISWQQFTDYSKQFYFNKKAQTLMKNHIYKVLNRTNKITNISYKDDPTIMAWQLANEPRGYDVPNQFQTWIKDLSKYIKTVDPKHLISLGTEGNTSGKSAGVDALIDNDDLNIDYITMHIWAQNWGWFSPEDGETVYQEAITKVDKYWDDHLKIADQLNKPIVLEEFGLARDNSSYSPSSTTLWRDRYYDYIFNKVVNSIRNGDKVKGLNFWSYSGVGRPDHPGLFWQKGDTFVGDPPHERQGWYGVYSSDSSTLEIIRNYTKKLSEI